MEENVYLTILFDYYEKLLNDKDKDIFKQYYFENLSLSEIADNNKVSRSAIHKRIKKLEEELISYEKKLSLYKKEQDILKLISDEKLKEKIKNILN